MACHHVGKPSKKLAALCATTECRQPNCTASNFDLWICIEEGCGYVACGRGSKGHAEAHAHKKDHHVSMHTTNSQIWCYACDMEVLEAERGPADYNQRIKAFRAMAVPPTSGASAGGGTAGASGASAGTEAVAAGPVYPGDFWASRASDAASASALSSARNLTYPPGAGLTGLVNLGNTCFLGAGMQALSNLPALAATLAEVPPAVSPEGLDGGSAKMVASLRKLIVDLWDTSPRSEEAGGGSGSTRGISGIPPVRPTAVLASLRRLSPLFEGFQQQDAHEALRTILGELHERLAVDVPIALYANDHGAEGAAGVGFEARGKGSSRQLGGSKSPNSGPISMRTLRAVSSTTGRPGAEDAVDSCDEDEGGRGSGSPVAGREWLSDGPYTGPDVVARSIVTDCFQGIFSSRVRCRGCKAHSITYEPFLDLSLPLPAGRHPVSKGTDGSVIPPEAAAWAREGETEAVLAALEAGSGGSGGEEASSDGVHGDVTMGGMEEGPVIVSNSMRDALASGPALSDRSASSAMQVDEETTGRGKSEGAGEGMRAPMTAGEAVKGSGGVGSMSRLLASLLCFLKGAGGGQTGSPGPPGLATPSTSSWSPLMGDPGLGLGDALYTFFGWESVQYACDACGRKGEADKRLALAALPEVLVVHLKRFSYAGRGSKNSSGVTFPLTRLDMTPFMWEGGATQAVRSFTRAKEQQSGGNFRLGAAAEALGEGAAVAALSAASSSSSGASSIARSPSLRRDRSGLPVEASPVSPLQSTVRERPSRRGGVRVLLEMSPDVRAILMHRASMAVGQTGVEAVTAEAAARQAVLQALPSGGTPAAAMLRFPSSFAAAYLSTAACNRLRAAGFSLAPPPVYRQPRAGELLPPALLGPVPVPADRRVSPSTAGGTRYALSSVVQHSGVFNGGHYVAHAKNRSTKKWYTFDDTTVSPVEEEALLRKEAYILFYSRIRPSQGPLAKAALPPDATGALSFFIARSWWARYSHMAAPGPLTNADILCDHGCLKNDIVAEGGAGKLVVALTAPQYAALATHYGAAEPPLRDLSPCTACVAEAAALRKRRKRERERITKVDTTSLAQGGEGEEQVWFIVSEHWLARWRAFINDTAGTAWAGVGDAPRLDGTGRGLLPPGPIDNARLLGKDGHPLRNLRSSTHYRGVNVRVWTFLMGVYGGGPVLRRAVIDIYSKDL